MRCSTKRSVLLNLDSVNQSPNSVAGYTLSSRSTRLTDESFESFLFANVNFESYDVAIGKKLKI